MRLLTRIGQLLLVGILLLLVSTSNVANPSRRSMPSTREINSSPIPQIGTQPDFQMQIEPNQFLVRAGSGGTPGLVFTPINGFAGNVTLSGTLSPDVSSAMTLKLPASVKLNASLPGSPLYSISVNTTTAIPLRLYTISVTGVSGSLSHSVSATVGVTNMFIPGNGAEMIYSANFTGPAFAGNSTVMKNLFEDLGYVSIGIWNLTVSATFGTYRDTGGLYCIGKCTIASLNPYEEKTTPLTIQIPANTSPGNYSLSVTIRWVLQPGSIYETPAPDLVAHGSIIVYSSSSRPPGGTPIPGFSGLLSILPAILGGVAASAAIMFVLLSVIERRRKDPFGSLSTSSGTPAPMIGARTCPSCGAISLEAKFCDECGRKFP